MRNDRRRSAPVRNWAEAMKINVGHEVNNAIDWPLMPGHLLIVKPYGQERWVRAVFLSVSFPVVWVRIGTVAQTYAVTEMGTRWIRCRLGRNGEPKIAEMRR